MSEDLAYIAALVDGEGCIGCYSNAYGSYRLEIKVAMYSRESVEVMADYFGLSLNTYTTRANKKYWIARAVGHKAKQIIEELYPYLRAKRQHAEVALEFPMMGGPWELTEMDNEDREMVYDCLKALNHRGSDNVQ